MDTMSAFAMGDASRGRERKVFDWDRAAELIKAENPIVARAGLEGDLEWTCGEIYVDGEVVAKDETYTYLASTWATPLLIMDGYSQPCYRMESETEYNEDAYWPESAINILNERK